MAAGVAARTTAAAAVAAVDIEIAFVGSDGKGGRVVVNVHTATTSTVMERAMEKGYGEFDGSDVDTFVWKVWGPGLGRPDWEHAVVLDHVRCIAACLVPPPHKGGDNADKRYELIWVQATAIGTWFIGVVVAHAPTRIFISRQPLSHTHIPPAPLPQDAPICVALLPTDNRVIGTVNLRYATASRVTTFHAVRHSRVKKLLPSLDEDDYKLFFTYGGDLVPDGPREGWRELLGLSTVDRALAGMERPVGQRLWLLLEYSPLPLLFGTLLCCIPCVTAS